MNWFNKQIIKAKNMIYPTKIIVAERRADREGRGEVGGGKNLFRWRKLDDDIDRDELWNRYTRDGTVFRAVERIVSMTTGAGFHTTVSDPENKQLSVIKQKVDDFSEEINLDELTQNIMRYLCVEGNAFLEIPSEKGVPLNAILRRGVRPETNSKGTVQYYYQKDVFGRMTATWKPDEMVHFKLVQYKDASMGIGIIYPIITVLRYKEDFMSSMDKILKHYSSPRGLYKTDNKENAQVLHDMLGQLGPDEDPIAWPKESVEYQSLAVDSRARFDFYIDYIDEEIFEGLGAPLLSYLRNSTQASSKEMNDIVRQEIARLQRYLKRRLEKFLFKPLIESIQVGAEVPKIEWGLEKTGIEDVTFDSVANLKKEGCISRLQSQKLLESLGLPIEVEEEDPNDTPEEPPNLVNPEQLKPEKPSLPTLDFETFLEKVGDSEQDTIKALIASAEKRLRLGDGLDAVWDNISNTIGDILERYAKQVVLIRQQRMAKKFKLGIPKKLGKRDLEKIGVIRVKYLEYIRKKLEKSLKNLEK